MQHNAWLLVWVLQIELRSSVMCLCVVIATESTCSSTVAEVSTGIYAKLYYVGIENHSARYLT